LKTGIVTRQDLDKMQKHDDFNFVIFGATGDLTKRKLIPALYNLYKNKSLGENFIVTCIARKDFDNENYLEELKKFYKKNFKNLDEKIWNNLASHIYYFRSEFNDESRLYVLSNFLSNMEKKHGLKENRIYYFATMPENYQNLINFIRQYKLNNQKEGWKRIVIEKPFGSSLNTAKNLNKILKKAFDEKQIFRIDHYLGKETIENILVFRFTNTIFEPVWNRNYIDHIQITVAEDIDIQNRGSYYDKAGAVRDMMQNHLLQILNMVTMDCPGVFDAENMRREKTRLLEKIKVEDFAFGQYEGYRTEEKVNQNSNTETFAALKLFINNSRWKGVPFYIRTGKKLKKQMALVYIKFRDLRCIANQRLNMSSNELIIQIQPEHHIYIHFNIKKPGLTMEVGRVNMDFCYECIYGNTAESYEKLIVDMMEGNLTQFTSWEETKNAWKIVDPVIKKLQAVNNLEVYKSGSWGPATAEILINKYKRSWYYY